MLPHPLISFFVSGDVHPVSRTDALWKEYLPMNRSASSSATDGLFRCGEYFEALERFLSADGFGSLIQAFGEQNGDTPLAGDLEHIHISMEKHGPFYHPARIMVQARGRTFFFVVNVALSSAGCRMIEGEYHCLKRLRESFAEQYVPKVYAIGRVVIHDDCEVCMFLGEWFDGFHEFHLSVTPEGEQGVTVWDSEIGHYRLSNDQANGVYCMASRILTYYYDTHTGRQIFPWHHAAGDFILKNVGGELCVHLVTVRQYAAMMELDGNDPAAILNGLLVFFLNLSIRMRIDRLDGVGELCWIGDFILPDIAQGFLEGLDMKTDFMGEAHPSIRKQWADYFGSFSVEELMEIFNLIVASYSAEALESTLIRQHLQRHAEGLTAAVHGLLP